VLKPTFAVTSDTHSWAKGLHIVTAVARFTFALAKLSCSFCSLYPVYDLINNNIDNDNDSIMMCDTDNKSAGFVVEETSELDV